MRLLLGFGLLLQRYRLWLPALALAFAGLVASLPALAAEKVYTVANYPVEATAENAVAAKEKALADGQQAAFRSLLKRLVPVMAFPHVKKLASVRAADLIEGVRVRNERNSRTDYIASFDFSFQSKGVRDLLRREGIPFVDDQAPVVTVVPLWRSAPMQPPREEAAWTRVWKGLDLDNALTPVKLLPLRGEIRPETVNALANGDGSALRALAAEYNTEFVVVALAEPDQAAGRLAVTLAGRDAVGGITLRRPYRVDPRDPGYASELAAVVALRTLEGRWKAVKARGSVTASNTTATPGATDLLIAVEFRGMSEWQEISRKLSAIPGVEELEVAGLSARGARVTLRFLEGGERLADELAGQGLFLRNNGGSWVLSLR
jgi:Uncharacterized protein conserved in bacteria (DUF2066)